MQFKIYIFFSTHKVCSWDHNVTDRRSLPGQKWNGNNICISDT